MNDILVDYVEIYIDEADEYRWRAKAGNHEIVADSGEGYESYAHTENMVVEMFPDIPITDLTSPAP